MSPLPGGRCQVRGVPAARQLPPASPLLARALLSGALTLPRTIQSDRTKQKILEFPQPRSAASRSQLAAPLRDFVLDTRDEPVTERSRDGVQTGHRRPPRRRETGREAVSAKCPAKSLGSRRGRKAGGGAGRAAGRARRRSGGSPRSHHGGRRRASRGPRRSPAAVRRGGGQGSPGGSPSPCTASPPPPAHGNPKLAPSPAPEEGTGGARKERKEEQTERASKTSPGQRPQAPTAPARPRCSSSSGGRRRRRSGSSPSPAAGAGVHESGGAKPAAPELSGITSSRPRPPWASPFPSPSRPPPPPLRDAAAAAGLVPPQDTLKEPHLHGPRTPGAAQPGGSRPDPPRAELAPPPRPLPPPAEVTRGAAAAPATGRIPGHGIDLPATV